MRIKDGAIQLTHAAEQSTALLTVIGKDHDLTSAELRELAAFCLQAAQVIDLVAIVGFIGSRS